MRKSLVWVLYTIIFIIMTVLTVTCFVSGAYFTGSVVLIGLGFVTYAILDTTAFLWKYDKKVQEKFTFRCKYCGFRFVPTFLQWLFVPHIGSKRYFKCGACGNRHFMRRK